MSFCDPGDQIICKVRNGAVVGNELKDFDYLEKCEIATHYSAGYLAFPHSYLRKEFQYIINSKNYIQYAVHKRFINSALIFITDYNIVSISRRADGIECNKCGEFFPMAEPNAQDGSFLCFLCRTYKYRF